MFGYIRPFTPELKVYELELFKSAYCTLCHTLKNDYGYFSRFILNYDFTFLAMLLWPHDGELSFCKKACPVSPIKKKQVLSVPPKSFSICAGYSVILTYWKLRDSISDEPFFKSLKSRAALLLLRRGYKKAARSFPEFERLTRGNLCGLSELEQRSEPSIDAPADKFASILAGASESAPEKDKRIFTDMLYHIGRWIYITDAYNDLSDDIKTGNYNPIAAKYGIKELSDFTSELRSSLELTLKISQGRVSAAFELLDDTVWAGVIRNIIYLGMPGVFDLVKQGKFDNNKEKINKIGEDI